VAISVEAGSYYRVNSALVLEDNPVGDQSRLEFETWPEAIEEVYALTSYREIGADRMPQPGGVAYRGGNWSTFSLQLQFRAGMRQSGRPDRRPVSSILLDRAFGRGSPPAIDRAQFEHELKEMERKARWCQALAFPLRRGLGGVTTTRILKVPTSGRGLTSAVRIRENLAKLKRNDPPKVLVVFGSWMTVRGYCTNVGVRWEPPFDPDTARPYGCTVNIQIQPLLVEYPTWHTIRNGAWNQKAETQSVDATRTGDAEIQKRRERDRRRASTNLGTGLGTGATGIVGLGG